MTMPVSVPSAAPTTAKGTPVSAPHGKTLGHEGSEADPTGVADMFAALVATLTEQMQPVAEEAPAGESAEVAVEDLAAGAVPVEALLTAPVLLPTVPSPAPAPELADVEVTVVEADATVAPVVIPVTTAAPEVPAAVEIVADDAVAPPAVEIVTDDAVAPPAVDDAVVPDPAPAEDGEHRAAPAVTAKPQGGLDDGAAPEALRATPAQPATPAQSATPPTPATPAALANDDAVTRPVLPTTPAPAAQAAAAVAVAPAAAPTPVDAPAADSSGVSVLNLNGPAAPARAEAPAPVVAPPPTPVADAHVQVARVVRPLRLSSDGAYELALDLTPAELGRVRIDVELRGSTISLSLRADNPATRELLAGSMNQLRTELEAAGLNAGHLDVGGRGTDGRGAPGQDRRPGDGTAAADDTAAAPAGFTDSLTDDSVDVRA